MQSDSSKTPRIWSQFSGIPLFVWPYSLTLNAIIWTFDTYSSRCLTVCDEFGWKISINFLWNLIITTKRLQWMAGDNGDVHVQLSWFVNVSWCALEKCHFNENITQIPFGDREVRIQPEPEPTANGSPLKMYNASNYAFRLTTDCECKVHH